MSDEDITDTPVQRIGRKLKAANRKIESLTAQVESLTKQLEWVLIDERLPEDEDCLYDLAMRTVISTAGAPKRGNPKIHYKIQLGDFRLFPNSAYAWRIHQGPPSYPATPDEGVNG